MNAAPVGFGTACWLALIRGNPNSEQIDGIPDRLVKERLAYDSCRSLQAGAEWAAYAGGPHRRAVCALNPSTCRIIDTVYPPTSRETGNRLL